MNRPAPIRSVEGALAGVGSVDLNLFLIFAEIVELGSLTRAALALQMPKSTLSRKLRQLEQQVGAVLLKRGVHALELTEIGRVLLCHCQRIASEAAEASQLATEMQSGLKGVLRISLPLGLNDTWITRVLASFASQYPEVKLVVDVTNRWVDVSGESYDVAIHVGRILNEQLPARRLATLTRGLYASPAYLARKGVPQAPEDLLSHDCIALESQLSDRLWTFDSPDGRGGTASVTPRMRVTDIIIAREMAAAGVGLAILTEAVCTAQVSAGQLVKVLPQWRLPPVAVSATFLERRHLPRRIRVLLDQMAQAMQAHYASEDPTAGA
jgi:DNA-binding transcriptional LysR family regulator